MIDCICQLKPAMIPGNPRANDPVKTYSGDPVDWEFFDLLREKDSLKRRLMNSHLRGAENPRHPVR